MFDENASQIELNDFVMHTLLDTSYIAVIGPETSPKAEEVATIFANYYKNYSSNPIPLMLLVATSVDLQRKYVDCDWCWCLSESNIAQSKILLTMAHSLLIDKIILILSTRPIRMAKVFLFGYHSSLTNFICHLDNQN